MKTKLLILLSSVLLAGCAGNNLTNSGELEPVKIGVLVPLSGGASAYGEEMMMVLNHKNKMLDTPAELYFEDSKCEAGAAVTAFQKLVDINGVDAILGGFCSSETLAIEPLLDQSNIVALSATSSSPEIEGKSKNLMSLSYSDKVVGSTMLEYLMNYEKIAIITEQNDYNIGLKNELESKLKDKIVADETFEKSATDMRNIIEKVKASNPEILFINPNVGDTASNLLNQLSESKEDFQNVELIGSEAYISDDSRLQALELTESMTLFASPSLNSKKVTDFVNSLEGPVDTLGVFYTATASDALENLVRSVVDSRKNDTTVLFELSSNPVTGLSSNGKSFNGNNFLQGIKAGKYVVTDGKAVLQ